MFILQTYPAGFRASSIISGMAAIRPKAPGSRACIVLAVLAGMVPSHAARAQSADGVLIDTFTPEGFVVPSGSIVQAIPPEWTPVGASIGAFEVNAQLRLANGVTTNTYQTADDPKASVFYSAAPSLAVKSDWSRHSLGIRFDAQLQRYVGEAPRNETSWNAAAQGRVDVSSKFRVRYEITNSLQTRNIFSGDLLTTEAPISQFRQDAIALNATYTSGRARLSVDGQLLDYRFLPLKLIGGGERAQSGQNRQITRFVGQFQYALSPAIGLYVQADVNKIDFDQTVLGTVADSDSSGQNVLAGAEITIAGYASATVGIGYSIRNYDEPGIKSVKGIAAEAKVQAYLTKLTTFSLQGGRRISSTALIARDPYKQVQAIARLDHSLRRNLLLTASASYFTQDYIGLTNKSATLQGALDARYLASPRLEFGGALSYATRSEKRLQTQQQLSDINEFRAQVRATLKL